MAAAYDAVTISVRVAGKSYVESVFEIDHSCHRINRRRIHPDLAVPIDRHEAKGRIDGVIHNLQIESVAVTDGIPVSHAGAAQRIDTDANFALADRLKIDHRRQIAYIRIEVRMDINVCSVPSTFKRYSHDPAQVFGN